MNYIDIYENDVANGVGIRVVLWVSGCSHHCPGCHNPQTWNPNAGELFDDKTKDFLFSILEKEHINGITLSGGDPLYDKNLPDIYELIKEIREKYPDKTIWLYTGYTVEDVENCMDCKASLLRREILKHCDVVVDGPFIMDKRNISLPWCGSSNQRVIDIKESIKNNKLTLFAVK